MWVAPSGSASLLGAGRRTLRRRRVAAERGDHRDRRLGSGEPDRLAELGRQPAGLLRGGDRDVPVGQANRQDRLRRQQARQATEAPLRPGAVDRDCTEPQAVVKGARHHSGRGQEPSVLRARDAAVGCLAQAADHLRRVGVRMGVRMDRDQPRIRGGGRSCAIGGVHNQLASVRARARPPRARGGDPEQVVVQVAIACRAGLLGDRDQIGHPRIVNQRARIQELADPARAGDVQGVEIEALELAQHRDRDVRSPALKGQLGGGEHATLPGGLGR